MRILIIDDHIDLITNIFAFFEKSNYVLDAAQNAFVALELCQEHFYDLIILDWMLPKKSGLEFLQQLREQGSITPVIMLTAKTELHDKLQGFETGADDYITKPFSLEELEARIKALYLRSVGKQSVLQIADLKYDLRSDEVSRRGQNIRLHASAKKLLVLLMRESPNVVSKERLEFLLWRENPPEKDLLRTHIYELRRRIDANYTTKLIKTSHKLGYQIAEDEID